MNELETHIIKYIKDVERFLLKITRNRQWTEDLLQEAIVRALKSGGPREYKYFKTWLFTVALNVVRNKKRQKEYVRTVHGFNFDSLEAPNKDYVESQDPVVLKEQVMKVLNRVSKRQRQAFSLRFFEDKTFQEIADIMNCKYDTAKSHYRFALLKVRDQLVTHEPDD